jgi:hypothetical protein
MKVCFTQIERYIFPYTLETKSPLGMLRSQFGFVSAFITYLLAVIVRLAQKVPQ